MSCLETGCGPDWDDEEEGLEGCLKALAVGALKFVAYGWFVWPIRALWRRLRAGKAAMACVLIAFIFVLMWESLFHRGGEDVSA